MADEIINTNSFNLNPEGRYVLEVEEIRKKVVASKKSGKDVVIYELHGELLDCEHEVDTNTFKLGMFPNGMVDVLKAVGSKEKSPGNFVRPTKEELAGKCIEFHIVHQADRSGTLREVLIEVKPFKNDVVKAPKGQDVAWDD